LGGISHQTVAGFLSTSSSGGSTKYSMADAIEEIGFVDGMGVYRRVSAKGDEKDIFYAVGVSMGLLGVITDVTFKLVPRYFVAGEEINQEMKTSYPTLDKTLFNNNEFIHINWFAQKYLNRITLWHGKSVSTDEKITPYNHVLSSKVMALAASDVLYTTNILNETSGDSDRTQEVIATFLKPFVLLNQKQNFCDTWYKALPIDDQANVDGLMNTSFSEIWFPRDQFDNVMQTTNALFAKHPKAAGNLIVELYCAKESPFWLSPAYGQDALRMDLYWWNHNSKGDANNYFGQFYEAFKTIPGTRFHWGKHLPHPGEKYGEYTFMPEHLQKNYPKLGEFLQLREKLDPQQIFVTDYWRNMLSIPKPVPQVKPWRIYETGKYVFGMFYKEQVPAIPCEEKTALQKLFK
jgi:D-arabinono-1,4-lactone oxidase